MSETITIEQAAEIMRISPHTLRVGLQQGVFPFGVAFKKPGSNRYCYQIFPNQFYKFYGRGN